MLARALPDVPLIVCASRYQAGRVAEARFGATVHLLDDGFQHIRLARDIDLLLVSSADLDEAVLPSGRLREPLDAARGADALLVPGTAEDAARVGGVLGVPTTFSLTPSRGTLRVLAPFANAPSSARGTRVIAVAGIARPVRFFDDLRVDGFDVVQSFAFRDHHWFTARDVQVACDAALALGAAGIVTTEKDAVRLEPLLERAASLGSLPWASVPYSVRVEPADAFRTWLLDRLAHVRRGASVGAM
jgi:tetraacyldisaccharide 4'-kinase